MHRDARCVFGERYPINANRYDINVYQVGDQFYADWFCEYCHSRGETGMHANQEDANQDSIAVVRAHHVQRHAIA